MHSESATIWNRFKIDTSLRDVSFHRPRLHLHLWLTNHLSKLPSVSNMEKLVLIEWEVPILDYKVVVRNPFQYIVKRT